jgi:hypothetical protein
MKELALLPFRKEVMDEEKGKMK